MGTGFTAMQEGLKDSETEQSLSDITGVILAGGKSTRYGKNKSFVEVHGVPLIRRVINVLKGIFQEIIIITNSPYEYHHLGLPMYEDIIKGLGPIGGIYTGLKHMKNEKGLFVACDMPFLNPSLIVHMIESIDDFNALVPRMGWKIEALHSIYTKSCIPHIEDLIDTHQYQVIKLFERVRTKFIEKEEIELFDPDFKSFININCPDDLKNIIQKRLFAKPQKNLRQE